MFSTWLQHHKSVVGSWWLSNQTVLYWPLWNGLTAPPLFNPLEYEVVTLAVNRCAVTVGTARRGCSPLAVPNVTVHPSTASVPIIVLIYNGPLLCGFNVPIKGLTTDSTVVAFTFVAAILIICVLYERLLRPSIVACNGRYRRLGSWASLQHFPRQHYLATITIDSFKWIQGGLQQLSGTIALCFALLLLSRSANDCWDPWWPPAAIGSCLLNAVVNLSMHGENG